MKCYSGFKVLFSAMMGVMVGLNCLIDGTLNHFRKENLSMSVKEF